MMWVLEKGSSRKLQVLAEVASADGTIVLLSRIAVFIHS